LQICW